MITLSVSLGSLYIIEHTHNQRWNLNLTAIVSLQIQYAGGAKSIKKKHITV